MEFVGKKFVLWPYMPDMPSVQYRDQHGILHWGRRIEREIVVTIENESTNASGHGTDLVARDKDGMLYQSTWDESNSRPYRVWWYVEGGRVILLTNAINLYNERPTAFIRPDGTRAVPAIATVCAKHDEVCLSNGECPMCMMEKHRAKLQGSV